jgi:hypothetical protein
MASRNRHRIGRSRIGTPVCAALVAGLVVATPVGVSAQSPGKAASRTIGFALTSWRTALYETPQGKDECPDGFMPSEEAQLKAMPEGLGLIRRTGGLVETRGPNGETGNFSPDIVKDPLPFRELKTTIGYGVNLDGTEDGHATAKTRKHEKFTSPDGAKVDNELARVLGCVVGYRSGGFMSDYYSQEVADFSVNRHLIEISGVDDEVNDPAVEVTIYKGYDRLVRTSDGKYVPYLSQRIDERFPQYTMHTRGRIVDGTLITDPIRQALLPHSSMRDLGERDMRDMTLRLKLTPDGADGLLAGYDQWKKMYNLHAKKISSGPGIYTSSSIFHALQRYADAYPDPKTGEFTYISAAYKVTAVRAMIVHPGDRNDTHVASARD